MNISHLPYDALLAIANKLNILDLIRFAISIDNPYIIRYKPWKSSELENVVEAFFHDLETSNFALKYDLIPHSVDMCYYAAKFNRMNVLRWCRIKKPSIPRFRPPLPWDFKAFVLASKYDYTHYYFKPNDLKLSDVKSGDNKLANKRMVKFMNSTHYYGKCPRKLCTTMVECSTENVLTYLGTFHVGIVGVTDYGTELAKGSALPVIMKRKGLRLINQDKPKPDIFDENNEIISSLCINEASNVFSSEDLSHLRRIEIMDFFDNVSFVKLKQQKKVGIVKYSKTKIKMKADKYPKRRVDRYQKTQRRHNTRYNK